MILAVLRGRDNPQAGDRANPPVGGRYGSLQGRFNLR
jgi:hypothetical protein